ncbi:MAG: hypothetical protein N4A72_05160 [Bacteroidales bacterium]|jgi:hypothetical protein|nr:hypothetical protein [Bacteroidales bacterium]
MKYITILGLLFINIILPAQSVHYKLDDKGRGSSGNHVDISILTLSTDSTYRYQNLRFANKWSRRKYIVSERVVEYGRWIKDADTIKCYTEYPLERKGDKTYYFYAKNRIYYMRYPFCEYTFKCSKKFPWKRISEEKADMFLK